MLVLYYTESWGLSSSSVLGIFLFCVYLHPPFYVRPIFPVRLCPNPSTPVPYTYLCTPLHPFLIILLSTPFSLYSTIYTPFSPAPHTPSTPISSPVPLYLLYTLTSSSLVSSLHPSFCICISTPTSVPSHIQQPSTSICQHPAIYARSSIHILYSLNSCVSTSICLSTPTHLHPPLCTLSS